MNPVVRIFFVFTWTVGFAFAQAPAAGTQPRREAVRSALTVHPPIDPLPVGDTWQANRRLSPLERAQMREQVRQHGHAQGREPSREPGRGGAQPAKR